MGSADCFSIRLEDIGKPIRLEATVSNSGGTVTQLSNSLTADLREDVSIVDIPIILGTAKVGQTLTRSPACTFGNPPLTRTIEWFREDVFIVGGPELTYIVQPADVGFQLHVVQVEINDTTADTAQSNPTEIVTF